MKIRKEGKYIWLLGRAKLTKSFAIESLIDEIILTIIPVSLKEGIRLDLNFDKFKLIKEKYLHDNIEQKLYIK